MALGTDNWNWLIAFFPIWLVMAGLWFALAYRLKKSAGPKTTVLLDGAAMVMSLCCATGALAGIDCSGVMSVPFLDSACHASDLRVADLIGF